MIRMKALTYLFTAILLMAAMPVQASTAHVDPLLPEEVQTLPWELQGNYDKFYFNYDSEDDLSIPDLQFDENIVFSLAYEPCDPQGSNANTQIQQIDENVPPIIIPVPLLGDVAVWNRVDGCANNPYNMTYPYDNPTRNSPDEALDITNLVIDIANGVTGAGIPNAENPLPEAFQTVYTANFPKTAETGRIYGLSGQLTLAYLNPNLIEGADVFFSISRGPIGAENGRQTVKTFGFSLDEALSESGLAVQSNFDGPIAIPFSVPLGTGFTIEKGWDLSLSVGVTADPGTHVIGYFEDDRTFLEFFGETVQSKAWAENGAGEVKTAFPGGNTVDANGRIINANIAEVGLFGAQGLTPFIPVISVFDEDNNPVNNWFIGQPSSSTYAPVDAAAPDEGGIFRGTLVYPQNTPDGEYKISISPKDQEWVHEIFVEIGVNGFDFELRPFELASRTVNVGETTVYSLKTTNIGASIDSVSFFDTGVTNGWIGTFKDTEFQDVSPGESRFTTFTLTPGPSIIAGDSTAGFMFAQSQTSATATSIPISVAVSGTVLEGVQIYANSPIQLKPGQSKVVPISIVNDGTSKSQYIVSASDIPAGWLANIGKVTSEIKAQSQTVINARVTAPLTAVPGDVGTINVHANALNNNLLQDTIKIVFQVLSEEGHELRVVTGSQDGSFTYALTGTPYVQGMRDEGPDASPVLGIEDATPVLDSDNGKWNADNEPDLDFDSTALFPVEVFNDGDTADRYTISSKWVDVLQNHKDCDGNVRPDNWRISAWADSDTPIAPTGNTLAPTFQTPLLGVGESFTVYYNLAWGPFSGNGNCPGSIQGQGTLITSAPPGARVKDPVSYASLQVISRSQNDPADVLTQVITADHQANSNLERQGNGQYSGATHKVALGVEEQQQKLDITAAGAYSEFKLVGANLGNEVDVLRFEIPTTAGGWDFAFSSIDISHVEENDLSPGHTNTANRRAMDCLEEITADDNTMLDCNVGIGDRVYATVQATPTSVVEIGERVKFTASVTSGDTLADGLPGVARDVAQLSVEATGSYLFDLLPNPVQNTLRVKAVAGEPVQIPVAVSNLGTQDDRYLLQFSNSGTLPWTESISHVGSVFVPAGREAQAFLSVTAPAGTALGTTQFMQLSATSLDSPSKTINILDIQVEIIDAITDFKVVMNPNSVVIGPGEDAVIDLSATRLTGTATGIEFTLDPTMLPSGWNVVGANKVSSTYGGDAKLSAGFTLQTSSDTLASSRVIVPVTAKDTSGLESAGYFLVTFSSDSVGISLTVPEGTDLVVPGAEQEFDFTLTNNGNSVEQIDLSSAALPAGWELEFQEPLVTLQPLESRELQANVTPALDIVAGVEFQVVIRADAQDNALFDTVAKKFRASTSDLQIRGYSQTIAVAPTEEIAFTFDVINTGEAADQVVVTTDVLAVYEELVDATFTPATFRLEAGAQTSVQVRFVANVGLPSDFTFAFGYNAASVGPYLNSLAGNETMIQVLPFVKLDIDGDQIDEFAVDRDGILGFDNGFDDFLEQPGGKASAKLDMSEFLTADARQNWTITETNGEETIESFDFLVDGDGDGRQDFFIDTSGNGLPNVFWLPSRGVVEALEVIKDVNVDGIPEYFLDVSGDGTLDVFYDITTGRFSTLLKLDVNDDGNVDYGVDLNQNGELDDNEPVLFTGNGKIVRTEERRDVDGDGKLDLVIDSDGDGDVDLFVPHGQEVGIPIVLRDVNGDGILDWTYDADGTGGRESFYDPATGEAGFIDSSQQFSDLVQEYWYVGALFLLVAVLFVVLLVVTRRS